MTFIKTIALIVRLFFDIYEKNENKEIVVDEGAKSVIESSDSKSALIEDFNPLDNIPPELPPVIYIIPPAVTENEVR
jgi:hypothetical protein